MDTWKIIISYILPVIVPIVCAIVGGVCAVFIARAIRNQTRLNQSITIVPLKTFKLHYMAFAGVVGFLIFFLLMQLIDPHSSSANALENLLGMTRASVNVVFVFVFILLICVFALLITLTIAKSAVVDCGVYTAVGFTDWHFVSDYMVNREKATVILSTNRNCAVEIKGLTTQFKLAKDDISKLEFVLNKNINKFDVSALGGFASIKN